MNREIKFRAFVHSMRKMHTWGASLIRINHDLSWESLSDGVFNTNDSVIMQFTGLKDKHGKEIYEGDVVKCHYFYEALGEGLGVYEAEKEIIGQIAFQELGLWIECETEEDCGYLLWITGIHEESFEVIGNIYENPELLK